MTMDLRDFTNLGNDIGRRVTDAINTGDYSRLNRDIRRKVEQAFTGSAYDSVLDGKLYKSEDSTIRSREAKETQVKDVDKNTAIAARPPKKGGSIAMMIAGYTIAAVFGIVGIGLALLMIPASTINAMTFSIVGASAGFMVPFAVAGVALAVVGTKKYRFAKRFAAYRDMLAPNGFCQIGKLASGVYKTEAFTLKDLKKMIEKGHFPEGHIDDHKTCFMCTNEIYKQYLQAMESANEARAKAAAEEQGLRNMPEDLQQVIKDGEAYIKTICEANDAIPDEVISDKLLRMEIIVKKIFEYVRENPDQVGQLRKFMSYYMPTTEKLVKAYQQMDEETVQGKNMTKAKKEIAETLDTINEAYEKLYDSMYVDVAMDVSSDIAVLKTMFAQEGLAKDEMNGGR